jgi:hypothetical protein
LCGAPRSPRSVTSDERISEPAQLVADVPDASIPAPALYRGRDVTLPPLTLTAVKHYLDCCIMGERGLEPLIPFRVYPRDDEKETAHGDPLGKSDALPGALKIAMLATSIAGPLH